ncbi:MAG: hypothetical protein SchgKO_13810 [Schleiferiaceae bacterium]
MEKYIRGYKTLNTHKTRNFSAYFFQVNGTKYVVTAHWYLFSFSIQSKKYSFSSREMASTFFEKLIQKFSK